MFFPFAFSPTCTDELDSLTAERADIERDDTVVLAISCDSMWALRAFAERGGYDFPILSDSWPYGAVADAYGVFLPDRGIATRATFLINKKGIVEWCEVNDLSQARDVKQYCNVIDRAEGPDRAPFPRSASPGLGLRRDGLRDRQPRCHNAAVNRGARRPPGAPTRERTGGRP